ncbi:hypothetical protein Bpfe_004015 [Biomphalaria pfeifferi]|uniref:Uncharacterized protein n=1 Tax=Biomphalaria pfeifferi TaxID=112525 RepID=A0AAD8C5I2_BIOPF|nr:hypothetical protein Bpfe_004015 [Biomphalaria pfeifferi]
MTSQAFDTSLRKRKEQKLAFGCNVISERESVRDRESERETESQRERQRVRERDRESERETESQRERVRERERDRESERETERDRESERETERERKRTNISVYDFYTDCLRDLPTLQFFCSVVCSMRNDNFKTTE